YPTSSVTSSSTPSITAWATGRTRRTSWASRSARSGTSCGNIRRPGSGWRSPAKAGRREFIRTARSLEALIHGGADGNAKGRAAGGAGRRPRLSEERRNRARRRHSRDPRRAPAAASFLAAGHLALVFDHLLDSDPDDLGVHPEAARIQLVSHRPSDLDDAAGGAQSRLDAAHPGAWE